MAQAPLKQKLLGPPTPVLHGGLQLVGPQHFKAESIIWAKLQESDQNSLMFPMPRASSGRVGTLGHVGCSHRATCPRQDSRG